MELAFTTPKEGFPPQKGMEGAKGLLPQGSP
jgi:hypothetical protein